MQSSWFRKSRFKSGKGKAIAVGGAGLGYKERPGFGANTSSASSSNSKNSSSNDSTKSNSDSTSNRFNAMRDTFRSQYQSQVCRAIEQPYSGRNSLSLYLFSNSSVLHPIAIGKKMYHCHRQRNRLNVKIHLQYRVHHQIVRLSLQPLAYTMIPKRRRKVAGTEFEHLCSDVRQMS